MQGILEEFLNFSRPLVPLTVSAVDLAALCDEALRAARGPGGGRGVRLERVGEGPVHAACDPRKVKQVLMNLLHNAVEASPPGGRVTVEVESTPRAQRGCACATRARASSPEVAVAGLRGGRHHEGARAPGWG